MAMCSFCSVFSSMLSARSAVPVRYVLAGVGVGLLSSAIKRAARSSAYCVSLRERPPPSRRLVIRKLLACPCAKPILSPRAATDLIASARRQERMKSLRALTDVNWSQTLSTPSALASSSCAVMPSGAEEASMRAFKSARNMPVPMPSELVARRRMAAQALTAGMRHGLSNHTWLSSSSSLSCSSASICGPYSIG